jgi:hypothetical protein
VQPPPRSERSLPERAARGPEPDEDVRISEPAPESAGTSAKFAVAGQASADAAPPRPLPGTEAAIESRLWGETQRWERRKALVLERGGRVRVWLRDAELSPDSAGDTVAWLAGLVRESGLELEAVTINGCVVFGLAEPESDVETFG